MKMISYLKESHKTHYSQSLHFVMKTSQDYLDKFATSYAVCCLYVCVVKHKNTHAIFYSEVYDASNSRFISFWSEERFPRTKSCFFQCQARVCDSPQNSSHTLWWCSSLTDVCKGNPGNELELDICLFGHPLYNLREPLRGGNRWQVGISRHV